MAKITDPRPRLSDRFRAAWRAFRDPNGTYLGAYDPSTEHIHTTDIGGVLGDNVIITQTDGQPPLVALIEIESPQHEMTPARARLEAYRLLIAADFAERSGLPTVTDQLVRQLAEVLEAR